MNRRYVESTEEAAIEIASRSQTNAAVWCADWLHRRDLLNAEALAEQLADGLERLATELRGEAQREANTWTSGLIIAAAVLVDTACEVRVGKGFMTDS